MSENELPEVPATALGPIRPLSVRITDGLRAQIEVIAQLNDRSVCLAGASGSAVVVIR
ncbi:hypothetical protein [Microbacterium lacticum]